MAVPILSWLVYGLTAVMAVFVVFYLYMTRNFNYWKKRGVLEIPPTPFVGNLGECCLLRLSVPKYYEFLYKRGEGLPYIGLYIFDKPALVLRDPEIIKYVLVKGFDQFPDRYLNSAESDVVGGSNSFFMNNPLWKDLRQKITPVFSSGKIKAMFPLFAAVCDDLYDHLESLDLKGEGKVIEVKEISAKYATDIIGSSVFGLQVNSLNNPDAEFRKYGKKIFGRSFRRGFELMSIFFIPNIVRPLRFTVFPNDTTTFLRKVFWETVNERLKSGLRRHDLIDVLIDLKNSQVDNGDPDAFKFDGDNLVGQAAGFFAAGFETTAALMSFTFHELSLNPDVQTKLRREIQVALEKADGKLSYDMVQELSYLDKVACETLRKYPSLPYLERLATADYKVPETGLVIEKGTPIYVPLLGLHYDPKYFPDPEKYDPERFSEENKRKRQASVYLPFGDGPRICPGLRFGLLQAKVGIIQVISNYEVSPCDETLIPMRIDPKTPVLAPEGGLYHRIRKIEKASS